MDEPSHPFHAFGPAHLTIIFLTAGLPFLLALIVRRTKSRFFERSIALTKKALKLEADLKPADLYLKLDK